MVKEKRKERRIKEEIRVAIEMPGTASGNGGPVLNALTQDISIGGARIMSNEYFATGTVLKMTLFLSRSKQAVRVQAEVRWSRTVEAGFYEMGVEFEHGIPLSVMALINHLYGKDRHLAASLQASTNSAEVH